MSFYLSPLVAVNEIDLSTTIPAVATSIGVIALKNSYKGPEKKMSFISSETDLLRVFGEPTTDYYADWLSAAGFLKYGNKLYATRVMPPDAKFAGVTIADTGIGNAFVAGGWGLVLDTVAGGNIGSVGPIGTVDTITDAANDHTPNTYADVALGGGSGTGAKATVVVDGTGLVTSVTITDGGTAYALADNGLTIPNATIGGAGAAATVDVATITGYELTTIAGGDILDGGESYEGSDALIITNGTGGTATGSVASVSAGGVVTGITISISNEAFNVGDTLTVVPGADSGFPTQTLADLPSEDPDDFGTDVTVTTTDDLVWLIASSRGTWGNDVQVAFLSKLKQTVLKNRKYSATGTGFKTGALTVSNGVVTAAVVGSAGSGYLVGDVITMEYGLASTSPLIVRVATLANPTTGTIATVTIVDGGAGYSQVNDTTLDPVIDGLTGAYETFQGIDSTLALDTDFLVAVWSKGQRKTTYELVETYNVSTSTTEVDDTGNKRFAEDVINSSSNYIRIALDSTIVSEAGVAFPDVLSVATPYSLSGGSEGTWGVGELTSELQLAYDLYNNPEEVDVNIFIESGDSDTTIKEYLLTMCGTTRKDCIAILDVPKTYVVNNKGNETTDLRTWIDGNISSSSYGAIYGNWLEVFDKYNQKFRWIPASGYVAGVYAKTDDVADPWRAPAGLNRAILSGVRRLAWNPSQGARDILYSNRINPIVSFAGEGKVVWGQKTLLSKESAFNRVNVRRLFLVLEKAIATAAKYFLFEPNDPVTRSLLISMIEPFLRDVKGRRGIYDFKVVCDDSNNTAERVDRNELWCNIFIKPTRTAEFVVLNFVATKTGASFDEAAQAVGG